MFIEEIVGQGRETIAEARRLARNHDSSDSIVIVQIEAIGVAIIVQSVVRSGVRSIVRFVARDVVPMAPSVVVSSKSSCLIAAALNTSIRST